jgi:PAS domain S-box-containing protein
VNSGRSEPGGAGRRPDRPSAAEDYRRRVYDVVEDGSLTFEEVADALLALGREYLGVENGHVERMAAGGMNEVVASVGGGGGVDDPLVPVGAEFDRAKTFCRLTVERETPLALSDAADQGYADDPARREHGVDCYLGATVYVRGKPYGTVCFVDPDPRPDRFEATEKSFVELLARTLGRRLERRAHDRVERKYESLVETAPDAVLLVDAETRRVEEANEAARALLGRDEGTLVGTRVRDLAPAEQRRAHRRTFDRLVAADGPVERLADGSPMRVSRPDGTTVPVSVSASSVDLGGREHVQAVLRDVSDRREREERLRLRQRAIDEASVGVTIADASDPDNEVIYVNEEFQRLTGYDRADVLGRDCRFLQTADTDENDRRAIREALANDEPVKRELLNERADGTPFWNELTVAPVEDETGETTHFVGFQRDVTDRRRRRRLLTVLNRVLRHNLRNETNAIVGYAELLAAELEGEAADRARRVARTGRRLSRLGEKARTLESAVRDPGTVGTVDLAATLDRVAGRLREEAPGATVRVDAANPPPALATERLDEALLELGRNALEHGEASALDLRVEDGDGGDEVRVVVADDGPGMPEMEQQVLESGRETPLEHGSGLGLAMVNWLVTHAGGRVTTTVADGTAVAVHLRTADGPSDSDSDPASDSDSASDSASDPD